MKKRRCSKCKKWFLPNSNRQKYCGACKPFISKIQIAERVKRHLDKTLGVPKRRQFDSWEKYREALLNIRNKKDYDIFRKSGRKTKGRLSIFPRKCKECKCLFKPVSQEFADLKLCPLCNRKYREALRQNKWVKPKEMSNKEYIYLKDNKLFDLFKDRCKEIRKAKKQKNLVQPKGMSDKEYGYLMKNKLYDVFKNQQKYYKKRNGEIK